MIKDKKQKIALRYHAYDISKVAFVSKNFILAFTKVKQRNLKTDPSVSYFLNNYSPATVSNSVEVYKVYKGAISNFTVAQLILRANFFLLNKLVPFL